MDKSSVAVGHFYCSNWGEAVKCELQVNTRKQNKKRYPKEKSSRQNIKSSSSPLLYCTLWLQKHKTLGNENLCSCGKHSHLLYLSIIGMPNLFLKWYYKGRVVGNHLDTSRVNMAELGTHLGYRCENLRLPSRICQLNTNRLLRLVTTL